MTYLMRMDYVWFGESDENLWWLYVRSMVKGYLDLLWWWWMVGVDSVFWCELFSNM